MRHFSIVVLVALMISGGAHALSPDGEKVIRDLGGRYGLIQACGMTPNHQKFMDFLKAQMKKPGDENAVMQAFFTGAQEPLERKKRSPDGIMSDLCRQAIPALQRSGLVAGR